MKDKPCEPPRTDKENSSWLYIMHMPVSCIRSIVLSMLPRRLFKAVRAPAGIAMRPAYVGDFICQYSDRVEAAQLRAELLADVICNLTIDNRRSISRT